MEHAREMGTAVLWRCEMCVKYIGCNNIVSELLTCVIGMIVHCYEVVSPNLKCVSLTSRMACTTDGEGLG